MTLIPDENSYWQFVGFMGRYGRFSMSDSGSIPINRWDQAIEGIAHWVKKEHKK